MMKIVNLILCAILLSSCSVAHKIVTKPIEKPPLRLESPKVLKLRRVKILVITPENASEVFKDLEARGIEPVLFALTGDDYKALSLNLQDIKNYVKSQRKIIILYKNYYEGKDDGRK